MLYDIDLYGVWSVLTLSHLNIALVLDISKFKPVGAEGTIFETGLSFV
jgi:hypothetical protein